MTSHTRTITEVYQGHPIVELLDIAFPAADNLDVPFAELLAKQAIEFLGQPDDGFGFDYYLGDDPEARFMQQAAAGCTHRHHGISAIVAITRHCSLVWYGFDGAEVITIIQAAMDAMTQKQT